MAIEKLKINYRVGMLGVSVRKMKAPTVRIETVTLIGKGR
jgi:hypothetical protein